MSSLYAFREIETLKSRYANHVHPGKSDVTAVKYNLDAPDGAKLYQLPPALPAPPQTSTTTTAETYNRHHRPLDFRRGRRPPRELQRPRPPEPDDPLLRRRHVYRHQLYSLRVGSNRISQYRELTPELFNRDEQLVSRARKWIRRELRVFSFLNPATEEEEDGQGGSGRRMPRAGQQRLESRRGNNAEFLLEYVIAILRTVDVKGSAGQAEELLRDFLGRDNARLFLHELQSWLRSPYTSLEDWDRNVQYEDMPVRPRPGPRPGLESDRRSTPVYGRDNRSVRGRVSKSYSRSPRPYGEGSSRDALTQARRLQHARDRYIPD